MGIRCGQVPVVLEQVKRPNSLVASVGLLALLVLVIATRADDRVASGPELADPADVYDPVRAGEPTPDGFRQLLRRDDIQPIYQPTFVSADDIDWEPETLIVGVAFDGEAKAYPVNFLNIHEMVNDRIGGTPILVSW